MSNRHLLLTAAALCAFMSSSHADTLVVPGSLPETGGTSTAIRSLPRTYMALYTDVNFASLTGPVLITGMQLRISAAGNATLPATWPSQALSFTNFNVQLSQASSSLLADGEFLSSSVSFAAQQAAGTVTTVRSGGLTVPVGAYTNTGAENAFGVPITFSTPYTYTPGQSLLLYLTHSGYAPSTEPQPFFATATFAGGVADAISSTVGYQAANGNGFSSPYIVQFTVSAVPEPMTALMLGGGLVALLALGRQRHPAVAQPVA
jgi:hypothetical protein